MPKQFINFNVDTKAIDETLRIISFKGSTGDLDRANDIVEPNGWQLENYAKNPVFLWAHNYGDPPIGKAVRVKKSKDGLDFDIKFATKEYEFSDIVFRLYKGGYLKAVSVGFIPIEWKNGNQEKGEPYRTIMKQELLELSGVSVPVNANALMNAYQKGIITDEEKKTFEYAAALEEKYVQESGTEEPVKKDACEIVDETVEVKEPENTPAQKVEPALPDCDPETSPLAQEGKEYDRPKAFNRLVTWAGISEDNLPDLTLTALSEQPTEMQAKLAKFACGFARVTQNKMHYMHHDIEDGALVTNFKGVASAMQRLLEDIYHGKIALKDGESAHVHLAGHYKEFKRIAPSFNLFKLEAIKELFAGELEPHQDTAFPEAKEAIPQENDANDADILTALLNGLEPEDEKANSFLSSQFGL